MSLPWSDPRSDPIGDIRRIIEQLRRRPPFGTESPSETGDREDEGG